MLPDIIQVISGLISSYFGMLRGQDTYFQLNILCSLRPQPVQPAEALPTKRSIAVPLQLLAKGETVQGGSLCLLKSIHALEDPGLTADQGQGLCLCVFPMAGLATRRRQ